MVLAQNLTDGVCKQFKAVAVLDLHEIDGEVAILVIGLKNEKVLIENKEALIL